MTRKPRITISLNYLELERLLSDLSRVNVDYSPVLYKLISAERKLREKCKEWKG